MKKIQKHHLPNTFGKIGYTSLVIVLLLAIALVAIFITSLIASFVISEKHSSPIQVQEAIVNQSYDVPIISSQKEAAHPLPVKILIGFGIITILGILSHYSGIHSSVVIRKILKKFNLRLTISSLFCAKFILLAIGFLAICIMAFIVPFVVDLLPVITIIAMISAGSFVIQLTLVHTRKISVKQTL